MRDWLDHGEVDVLNRPMRIGTTKRSHHSCERSGDGRCQFTQNLDVATYAYLLGQYVGDGCITTTPIDSCEASSTRTDVAASTASPSRVDAMSTSATSSRTSRATSRACSWKGVADSVFRHGSTTPTASPSPDESRCSTSRQSSARRADHSRHCAGGGTRTHTGGCLRPGPLPLGYARGPREPSPYGHGGRSGSSEQGAFVAE